MYEVIHFSAFMSFFYCSLSVSLLFAIKTMSFAYAKILMLFYPSFTPFLSRIVSLTTFSKAMLNRIGNITSPCLSPVVTCTVFDRVSYFCFDVSVTDTAYSMRFISFVSFQILLKS